MKYNFPSFSQIDPRINSTENIIQVVLNSGFKIPKDEFDRVEGYGLESGKISVSVIGIHYAILLFYEPERPLYSAFVIKKKKSGVKKIEHVGDGLDLLFHNEFGPASTVQHASGRIEEIFFIKNIKIEKDEFKRFRLKRRLKDVKNEI